VRLLTEDDEAGLARTMATIANCACRHLETHALAAGLSPDRTVQALMIAAAVLATHYTSPENHALAYDNLRAWLEDAIGTAIETKRRHAH
jgi:hypothetical protein